MTTSLSLTTTFLPGRLRDNGMDIPPDLSFDDWQEALHRAVWLERASPWFIVDLVAFGRAKFHEDYSQALPDAIEDADGFHQAKLRQAEWMADRWPASTRVPDQSYSAHRAVAKLNREDAVALLHETDRDGKRLTVRALTKRADEIEQSIQGKAVTLDGAPVGGDDLDWHPTKDQLVDECRASLEVRLSEMSSRMRPGFEAGWLAALVWVNALDCFKRDGE